MAVKGISSYQTYLMRGTESGNNVTWAKLIDIKEFPDLGGEPERLDITTLSDPMRLYIPGYLCQPLTAVMRYDNPIEMLENLQSLKHQNGTMKQA